MISTVITRKIPGGKLVRLSLTFSGRIESVKITGDFFLYPEDTLEALTTAIRNASLPLNSDDLTAQLNQILAETDSQFIGVNVSDLVSMLQEILACRPSE